MRVATLLAACLTVALQQALALQLYTSVSAAKYLGEENDREDPYGGNISDEGQSVGDSSGSSTNGISDTNDDGNKSEEKYSSASDIEENNASADSEAESSARPDALENSDASSKRTTEGPFDGTNEADADSNHMSRNKLIKDHKLDFATEEERVLARKVKAELKEQLEGGPTSEMPEDGFRVGDYHRVPREGGLNGSVGKDIPFDNPQILGKRAIELTEKVGKAVRVASTNLKVAVENAKKVAVPGKKIMSWASTHPWMTVIMDLLSTGCTAEQLSDVVLAGDSAVTTAFPFCLINYYSKLSAEVKDKIGQQMRTTLANSDSVKVILNPSDGLCPAVAAAIPSLPKGFCDDFYDLMVSVPPFVKMAAAVQKVEKEHLGESASMLQMLVSVNSEAAMNARISRRRKARKVVQGQSLNTDEEDLSPAEQLEKLKCKIVFSRLWSTFGISVMKEEARHLVEVWFNDPVHKWRYTAGLFNFITLTGTWLAVANSPEVLSGFAAAANAVSAAA